MNRLLFIVFFAIGVMSVAAALLVAPMEPETQAGSSAAVSADAAQAHEDDQALSLTRNSSGQFSIRASVNGSHDIEFLVDTGADLVALTEAEADALGILPAEEEFQPNMQTASGVGYGAPVTLDEVEVAGQRLQGVDAVVVRGLATNLLGQSVLRQLGSVELKGDKMVIRGK